MRAIPLSRRRLPGLVPLGFGTLLLACHPAEPVPPARATPRLEAAPVAHAHAVRFAPGSSTLAPAEAAGLEAFASSLPWERSPSIRVWPGAGDPVAASRRARAVADTLVARSPVPTPVRVLEARSPVPGRLPVGQDQVVVEARWHEVVLPGCPDWSRDPAFDGRNLPLANLGCANAANLGLMLARPADLLGRGEFGPADGVREAEAILRYRTDKVKQPEADALQP